jgi:hypothetical protein
LRVCKYKIKIKMIVKFKRKISNFSELFPTFDEFRCFMKDVSINLENFQILESHNFEVFYVWESEYISDKDKVLEMCLIFLNKKELTFK